MTPHLRALHLGVSLCLCTQYQSQGSSPELLRIRH